MGSTPQCQNIDDATMTTRCVEPLCRAMPEYHGVCKWHNIVWIERLTHGLERAVQIAVERTGIDVDWVGHEQGIPIPSPSLVVTIDQVFSDRTDVRRTLQNVTEPTKEPEIQDFGITPKDYALYTSKGAEDGYPGLVFLVFLVLAAVACWIVFIVTGDWGKSIAIIGMSVITPPAWVAWGALFGVSILISWLILTPARKLKRSRLQRSPIAFQIKLYEEALATYRVAKEEAERRRYEAEEARWAAYWRRQEAERQRQRKLEQYWISMDGVGFERELGGLFRAMGYGVRRTPTSGDQGVDLVLRKNGVTIVVQCKAHKNVVGPAVARELFGSMVAFRAKAAILACTGGFTKGVHEFVKGKPIRLLDASAIAKMAEGETMDDIPQESRSQPICPNCTRQMVLRRGRNGDFWGCSAYPRCRGTRDIGGTDFPDQSTLGTTRTYPASTRVSTRMGLSTIIFVACLSVTPSVSR